MLASTTLADAAGEKALDQMLAWYSAQTGVKADLSMSFSMPGSPEMTSTSSVQLLRPNLLKIESEGGGMPGVIVVSDGKTMWEALPDEKIWSEKKAPDQISTESSILLQAGPAGIVIDLMSKTAKLDIMDGFDDVTLGSTSEDGDVLELHAPSEGGMPAPIVKVRTGPTASPWMNEMTVSFAEPGKEPEDMMSVQFKDWTTLEDSPKIREAFAFTPDESWKKVDDVTASLMGPGPESADAGGPHPMIGKEAPDFTLATLEGKDVSLKSLRGKTIILDFWATWCGPCKQGLPVLMDIAKSRAADGVELWSVDLSEKNSKVAGFLEQRKWDLRVLMDTKGAVANSYGVKGIPHTVVIDPDGVVRLVEIGFSGAEHTKKAMNEIIDEIAGS